MGGALFIYFEDVIRLPLMGSFALRALVLGFVCLKGPFLGGSFALRGPFWGVRLP